MMQKIMNSLAKRRGKRRTAIENCNQIVSYENIQVYFIIIELNWRTSDGNNEKKHQNRTNNIIIKRYISQKLHSICNNVCTDTKLDDAHQMAEKYQENSFNHNKFFNYENEQIPLCESWLHAA